MVDRCDVDFDVSTGEWTARASNLDSGGFRPVIGDDAQGRRKLVT